MYSDTTGHRFLWNFKCRFRSEEILHRAVAANMQRHFNANLCTTHRAENAFHPSLAFPLEIQLRGVPCWQPPSPHCRRGRKKPRVHRALGAAEIPGDFRMMWLSWAGTLGSTGMHWNYLQHLSFSPKNSSRGKGWTKFQE